MPGPEVAPNGAGTSAAGFEVVVYAPHARRVELLVDPGPGEASRRVPLVPADGARYDTWVATIPVGAHYVVLLDGHRPVLHASATEVAFPPGHSRRAVTDGTAELASFPRAVARPWPSRRSPRRTSRPLVVYEAHARGLTRRRDRSDAGTYRAAIDELARLRDLGVSVLELLPVHQFDPDEANYWGYMPIVFGAVHRQYAAGDDPAAELADLVAAAHDHDIEVWLDVVVNHTTEGGPDGPTYNLRALSEREYYACRPDGTYLDDSGTGNMVDVLEPITRRLVMEALDRLADLGVDGFRFDLAAVLARDPDFVRSIGDWAAGRGVRLVAEPWDLARYLLGPEYPDPRWAQWNGEFRDDVRGFLRSDPDRVAVVAKRLAGSPDLFPDSSRSINFLTAHDGYTMYDLMAYDHRHNHANGERNEDGHRHNLSWNSGWEGDVRVPDDVVELRRRRIRSAFCMLLLAQGTPMFVAGDEIGRTQLGNNNAYNQDNEISWIDWERGAEFADLEAFVRRLISLRTAHPELDDPGGVRVRCLGATGELDTSYESRSLAWTVDGLYAMANMWWEPVEFEIQAEGTWRCTVDTSRADGSGDGGVVGPVVTVGPRSVVVLER